MSIQIESITAAIANLDITGLKVYGIDEIPAEATRRSPAVILMPKVFSNFAITRDSFGVSAKHITITYDLHYRLLYAPIGEGRAMPLGKFAEMVSMAAEFLQAVLSMTSVGGGIKLDPRIQEGDGIVNDPAEVPFWGCDILINVTEFLR